ncbi:alpha-amylase family protein [Nakamurella endophytica]|uniref:Alpha-amlyase n=1 Tax=Nakamurella endophytica TaxID=1748367 RepID=A0A917T2V5_9ACTN|nr:alpha-amylase family protein [Nakamurella endophytica]GGM07329.1 alpha-amlyase [Nakamurella endophytica]
MTPAPPRVHRLAADELAAAPTHRRELFGLQLDRWWTDLQDGLHRVYPADTARDLSDRLVVLAARAFADRDPDLARLDLQRTLEPDWFQSESMLGYACYADRFAGDLQRLRARIPYLRELGVTYLHLMPLLRPRPGDSDGGYAVADYRTVRENLGTVEDLRALATDLRHAGISLVLDLVLNHVAAEHEWAVRARAGEQRYRDYFYVYPDRTMPDAYERTLPEIFPDFAPGSFTWDDELSGWVWTTFNSWQWDVNWTNPDVFCEYADTVLFLAGLGVQVLRLDAIAFLSKRLGTDCQNQPEVHAITQALRAVARIACPAVLFKAEAIVGPADLVHYLGQGHHHGKVSDIAYHNSLMVQVWSMLASRDVRLAAHALAALPPAPSTTAWVTYLRCHDDIGWAIDDADAAAQGISGWEHRRFLADYYAGEFPGSPARGLVFQANPETGDRRISGMAASLAGLETAYEAALATLTDGTAPGAGDRPGSTPELDIVVGRLFLAHAVVLGWGGIPVVWMGDELGMTNDEDWASEPGHEADNRWAHRPRMDWELAEQRHHPETVPGRVWTNLRHLVSVRAGLPQLHAAVAAEIGPVTDPGVLPVVRRHPLGVLLELFNVTDTWRAVPGWVLERYGLAGGTDRISGETVTPGPDGSVWLAPYAAVWITAAGDDQG